MGKLTLAKEATLPEIFEHFGEVEGFFDSSKYTFSLTKIIALPNPN